MHCIESTVLAFPLQFHFHLDAGAVVIRYARAHTHKHTWRIAGSEELRDQSINHLCELR